MSHEETAPYSPATVRPPAPSHARACGRCRGLCTLSGALPGETYLLPSSGTLSDACVADGGVLSVQVLGGAVLVAAEDAGVTTLLLETTTPFGTTVYEERTVVVAEGGTYCWPCTPYSDSKDMLINRGWGVNGHKGIDVNYNKDYLTDSVAYTFAPGKVVGVFHYDRNTYGKWSGSDTYNKFNYSLAKEYPDIPGLYNTEVGGGAATRGNSVVMEHTIGGETVYSEIFHLQPGSLDFAVACLASGAELPAGTPIAVVGNTGQSRGATGIHLHFQLSTGEMGWGWLARCLQRQIGAGQGFPIGGDEHQRVHL